MVVVEGMDNTGKTTLGKALSDYFSVLLIRSLGHQKNLVIWVDWILEQLRAQQYEAGRPGVIYDRWPTISESVYGPELRGTYAFQNLTWLDEAFWRLNPVVIYCRPPKAKILQFGKREQMTGVKKNAAELIRHYDGWYNFHQANYPGHTIIRHDYTKDSVESLFPLIERHLVPTDEGVDRMPFTEGMRSSATAQLRRSER